jgi:prepilin peptidase CpaA
MSIPASQAGLIAAVMVFTAITAVIDLRTRRIPNMVNLPFFIAGLIYRPVFEGWPGLQDALLGFAVGFGTLFLLWMIGGGGGGDAKLLGALSVWLGFSKTLAVLALAVVFVLVGTAAIVFWGVITRGARKTRETYVQSNRRLQSKTGETAQQKAQRRIMTFAFPIACATWLVLGYVTVIRPMLPHNNPPDASTASASATPLLPQTSP